MTTQITTSPSVNKAGIVLANMAEMWQFAEAVIASGMAPKGVTNPSAAMVTIQMGMELGLPPMAALQNIANINGRPSVWGDAMLGIVRATGELEEFSEWFEFAGAKLTRAPVDFDDGVTAVCRVKRRGYDAAESSFSVGEAKRARVWTKQGPWTEYPARMLKQRARSFGLRDLFGDALRGLYSTEELRDVPAELMRDVTPQQSPAPLKVVTGAAASKPAPAPELLASALPTRDEMTKSIKARMKELGIGLPAAETRCRAAGLLRAGQTFQGTTDEELHAVFSNLDALSVAPEATPEDPVDDPKNLAFPAFYENHAVTRSPEKSEKQWTMYKLRYSRAGEEEIREAVTFSTTIGFILDGLEGAEPILLVIESGAKGDTIKSIETSGNGGPL